jgi:ketosteroid isomerase-like protein
MLKLISLPLLFSLFLVQPADPTSEVDALWSAMSATVASGDFEGYSALYHEDAVLVNGISGESYPIADALEGWKQGFIDTKAGKMTASVEFRFSERLHSENTAHDTGIFHYTSQMEGQEPMATLEEWESLK